MPAVSAPVHLVATFRLHQEEPTPATLPHLRSEPAAVAVEGRGGCVWRRAGVRSRVWGGEQCYSISGSVSSGHRIINRVFIAVPLCWVSPGLSARSQQWLIVPMCRRRRSGQEGHITQRKQWTWRGWQSRLPAPPSPPPPPSPPLWGFTPRLCQGLQISVWGHSTGTCLAWQQSSESLKSLCADSWLNKPLLKLQE